MKRKFLSLPFISIWATSLLKKQLWLEDAMYPSKNIIENAVNSKDHTT
jgi:hypothetical protein